MVSLEKSRDASVKNKKGRTVAENWKVVFFPTDTRINVLLTSFDLGDSIASFFNWRTKK